MEKSGERVADMSRISDLLCGREMPELKKNRYGRLLLGFFIAMLVLTVISRAADSVTVAKVETSAAKRGTLVHRASAEGTVKASDEVYVQGEKGFFIKKIHVAEGELVEKGAVLFTLDGEGVKDQLDDADSELAVLELNLKKLRMENSGGDQAAVDRAAQKLARARADDEFNTMINGGQQMQADKRAMEDAQAELAEAKAQLAEGSGATGVDIEIQALQIKDKERKRNKLRELYSAGGTVAAEITGTIGKIFAEQGKETMGETLCTIVPGDADYILEAEFDSEAAKYMKIGDEVDVTLSGKAAPVRGAKIKSLKGADGKTTLTAQVPSGAAVSNGDSASVSHESVTDEYDAVIPLSALRGTEGSYYVLTVQEAGTVLGAEKTAMETVVEVLDKDNKSVAIKRVEGNIIAGSNKPVKEGDRVREVRQ